MFQGDGHGAPSVLVRSSYPLEQNKTGGLLKEYPVSIPDTPWIWTQECSLFTCMFNTCLRQDRQHKSKCSHNL